tara:strand:+ start:510 stop:956 length:447 start_codon:yes stop_codon:yes gene_type:complete
MGCAPMQPAPPTQYVVVSKEDAATTAYQLSPPPVPNSPEFLLRTEDGLFRYTTAVNAYLYRVFFYTWLLNRFAIDSGWEAPDLQPLCLYVGLPEMDNVSDVVISPKDRTAKGIERSLSEYIKRSRMLYNDQKEDFKEFEKWYRNLCNI